MPERKPLPLSCPEEEGISSRGILNFISLIEEKQLCIHSLLILRHGKLCAECYWKPFHRDRKHRMYSTSKSFTSAAIGCLIGEGRLSLEDHLADYFPEYITPETSPFVREATIRDLLCMSTYLSTTSYWAGCDDWARSFFEKPATHKPGQIFAYDTSATTTLDILVWKLTGQEFYQYLEPRLFEPLGMSDDIWCVKTGCGHAWGGSGLQATSRDLAKFAQCIMSGGRAPDGRQLIPEWYVREATSRQIDNTLYNNSVEDQQGYGYQFWRLSHNGFATLGMGSQNAFCYPDQDLIIVVNGDTQPKGYAEGDLIQGVYDCLFPTLSDDALPADTAAQDELDRYIRTAEIAPAPGEKYSPTAGLVSGRTYRMSENAMHITSLRFDFKDDAVSIRWENDAGVHDVLYGLGRSIAQSFPESRYGLTQIGHPEGRGLDCIASAGWVEEKSLYTNVWITDVGMGSLRMQFAFEGDTVTMLADKNAEWFLDDYRGFASGTRV